MSVLQWILLFTLSILWGSSFYFVEKALIFFTFEQVVFFRIFFAAIFLLIVLLMKKIPLIWDLKLWLFFLLMGLLNNVLPFLGFAYAQKSITASLASILNATTPIFTVILAHYLTVDEKLTKYKLIGVIIGFIGIIILLSPKESLDIQSGIFVALISASIFALAGIYGKKLKGQDPLFSSFGMLVSSSLILFIIYFDSIMNIKTFANSGFIDIINLAIFSTAIAYVIYFKLLFEVGALKVLLVNYLMPISASILGILFLGEIITFHMLLGTFFIFLSLCLVNFTKNKK